MAILFHARSPVLIDIVYCDKLAKKSFFIYNPCSYCLGLAKTCESSIIENCGLGFRKLSFPQ